MKTRLIITNEPMSAHALRDAGVPDSELLCTTQGAVVVEGDSGRLWHLVGPDAYLPDDVPTNSNGHALWRAQDLPIIPDWWQREPRDEQRLSELIAAVQCADEIIHAGEANRDGQLAVDELLIAAGRDPSTVARCPMPGPASAGRNEEERACAALAALADPRPNHGAAMDAAAATVEKIDWLFETNHTRARSIARGRAARAPRWALPLAAWLLENGGRVLEADAITALGCAGGCRDVGSAVMSGYVNREKRRGAPWETHAPTHWRDAGARFCDLVPTARARQLIAWLGADHPLCQPPRDSEVLGAIEAGVLRATDWLREEEDFVREQVAHLLQNDSAAAAQH